MSDFFEWLFLDTPIGYCIMLIVGFLTVLSIAIRSDDVPITESITIQVDTILEIVNTDIKYIYIEVPSERYGNIRKAL